MASFTVRRRGTDSSGRGIYASDYMWTWWEGVIDVLGFAPVITQGAWMTMAGGGASGSAGYHDGGGCFDLRTRDLSAARVELLIRTLRRRGAAAWVRNAQHGGFSDPHIHLVLGSDHDLDSGAAYQWRQYVGGRDGLASNGPDYHWRPRPLVLTPPPEDDMPYTPDELAKIVRAAVRAELAAAGLDDLARLERDRAVIDRRKHGQTQAAVDEHDEQ